MKDRKTTISVLAASAVLVWALVAVQAVRWMRPEKDEPRPARAVPKTAVSCAEEPQDVDYADPFLKELGQPKPEGKPAAPSGDRSPSAEDSTPPPVVYKGLMDCSGVKVAIVIKDGWSLMLRKGDKVCGFSVRGFTYDELILERKGRKYRLEIE